MSALAELQACFMHAILDGDRDAALPLLRAGAALEAERLAIYANNAATNFQESLRLSFPATLRLVGEEYFSECAAAYRQRFPSRSGDLQYAGAAFAQFMGELHRQSEFEYLEDVARLEWLYQEALIAADHAPLHMSRLAIVPPDRCDELCFKLHPAARLFSSDYPALRIWEANLGAAEPDAIDLNSGSDRALLARTRGRLEFYRLTQGEYRFVEVLAAHAPFGSALRGALDCDATFDASAALRRFVLIQAIVDF